MRKQIFVISCAVVLSVVSVLTTGLCQEEDSTWLKSSYLQSIHDDCLVLLEGIEMFCKRDYSGFLETVRNSSLAEKTEAENYINELSHFEKLLDSICGEYISFKEASADKGGEEPGKELALIEKKIFQMLVYSYMRTGDVITAQYLMDTYDIMSEKFIIQIRGMDGRLADFQLTMKLEEISNSINATLTKLQLHVKNFFASEPQDINAYIKITGYDNFDPVNILFMEYYSHLFPGLNAEQEKMIHIGQLIKFFNMPRYSSHAATYSRSTGESSGYDTSYMLPIVKGTYEVVVRDPNITAYAEGQDEVVIERLCFFRGLARTDFRNLKEAEQQQMEERAILESDFSLLKPGEEYVVFKPGQMMPYGTYALFEKRQYLGTIETVPCYKGGDCKKPTQMEQAVTPVRIFDHELLLYRDVIDQVKRNNDLHGLDTVEPELVDPLSDRGEKERIGLFPGCVAPDEL